MFIDLVSVLTKKVGKINFKFLRILFWVAVIGIILHLSAEAITLLLLIGIIGVLLALLFGWCLFSWRIMKQEGASFGIKLIVGTILLTLFIITRVPFLSFAVVLYLMLCCLHEYIERCEESS